MRAILLCPLLIVGCSKKDAPTKEVPPPSKEPATMPAPQEVPKPPAEKPSAPPPSSGKIECGALVTTDDVMKACNVSVEIKATNFEGKGDLTFCNRMLAQSGGGSEGYFLVSRFADAAAADSWVTQNKADNKAGKLTDVSGLGDSAYTMVFEMKKMKKTDYMLAARKGNHVMRFGYSIDAENKKPPCTLEQLQEVAKATLARMP